MNKNLKIGIVVFLLVLCPLISYIYLKKGFEYQVDNFKELEIVQSLDSNLAKSIFPYDSALNKLNIVCLFSESKGMPSYINTISKINEQYQKVNNFSGYIFIKDSIEMNIKKLDKFKPIRLNSDEWNKLRNIFAISNNDLHGQSALIDVENNVRNHYDLSDEDSIKKLIAHASLLFPKTKSRR